MGVELASDDLSIYEVEDGYLSDSEAFASVINVLDGVRMVSCSNNLQGCLHLALLCFSHEKLVRFSKRIHVLVAQSDRDQYDYLLSIVDPGKRMGPDEEALLAVIVLFVECMLGLDNDDVGEFLGSTLLAKVVDLLTDLDVSFGPVGCCMRLCFTVFETLSEIFRIAVLKLHKSKFAQFLMFYACSLDPDICGLKFAVLLTDIFVSEHEDPDSR
ncbi:hypothetical protein BHE74_00038079 [Ensete ventricosum]|nr:hypothetical protein BHE74_00038079 [Ensete ventricosum]